MVKNLSVNAGNMGSIPGKVPSPGKDDPLEKKRATNSSILAWRISWTEEPGGLESMGSQRAGHYLVTKQ